MQKFDVVFHLGYRQLLIARGLLKLPDNCLKHSFATLAKVFNFDIRELTDDGIHVMSMTLEEFKDKFIQFLKLVPDSKALWPFVLNGIFCDTGEHWSYRAMGFAPISVKKASIAQADDPQEIMRRAMLFRAIEREFLRIRDIVIEKAEKEPEFSAVASILKQGTE